MRRRRREREEKCKKDNYIKKQGFTEMGFCNKILFSCIIIYSVYIVYYNDYFTPAGS